MTENTSTYSHLISEAQIKSLKSIEDIKVSLKPGLNILIGKNGAGKSNFLEALDSALFSIYNNDVARFKYASILFGGSEDILYTIERQSNKNSAPNNEEVLHNEAYQQKLAIDGEIVYDNILLENKEIIFKGKKIRTGNTLWGIVNRLGIRHFLPTYIQFGTPINASGIAVPTSLKIPIEPNEAWEYNVESALLDIAFVNAEDSFSDEFYELTDEMGEEEAWSKLLDGLNSNKIIDLLSIDDNVKDNLRLFTPIKDIRFNKNISFYSDDNNLILDNIRLDFYVNDHWLPWSQLSDGTKRLFFIVADVSLNKRSITLVEEPELGVHPHQFNLIMQFLKEQSEDQQIVISTHSPKALDVLEPNELDRILIASYEKGKGTQINRMTEEQKQKAVGYMENVGYLSDYWLLSDLEA